MRVDPVKMFAKCAPLLRVDTTNFCICIDGNTKVALVGDPVGNLHKCFEFVTHNLRGIHHTIRHTYEPPPSTRARVLDKIRPLDHVHVTRQSWYFPRPNITLRPVTSARQCDTFCVDLYE